MKQRLKRLLPNADYVRGNRWLHWLGPTLFRPQLWHITRRGVALGVALGIFFGLLVPVAQIPLSAAAAVLLRANLPSAIASTLVTNPITFAPIYYGAYHIGTALIGNGSPPPDFEAAQTQEQDSGEAGSWIVRITALGKPLLLGLLIVACSAGVLTYLLIMGVWRLKITLAWRRRRRQRRREPAKEQA
ncbi:MAG: DUF2062 domain-containing protein [Gammaproteobacteria bacterium]|nr:DUF2062 domain-containing protein [Gammaproteobacteria bacterium]MBU1624070.1 DUF2062 domain-containing protein [Gammaproteobacteria bacterium]MBU1981798.1 DUF2062 domain-containing protein [Gammaproteobacteria bacterium]